MNLEKNYQLNEVLRDDGVRTVRAREIASGRSLQVHFFNTPEERESFERIRGLPLAARRDQLEIGYEGQIPYIVTDPLPESTSARAWFTGLLKPVETKRNDGVKAGVWKVGMPLPDPLFPETPPSKPPSKQEPGEFTRMFQTSPAQSPDPLAKAPATPEPGEFTKMFQASPQPASEVPVLPFREADQATRLFETPAPPPPTKQDGPSEFTRFFQSPLQPPALKEKQPAADPFAAPKTPPPAVNRPGEFTQTFGNPARPPAAPPLGASATGAFAAPAPPRVRVAGARGPGEFTQMMSGGAVPTLGQQPPGQPSASTTPVQSKLPLLLILGAALLFAILIIVFFALRRR